MVAELAVDSSISNKIKPDYMLTIEQQEMVDKLEKYDIWFVTERLSRKQAVPDHLIDIAVMEFKKYMALIGLGYRNLAMLSKEVDAVWHHFILFTREYAEFCSTVFGEFIHHNPGTSRSNLSNSGKQNFIDAYEETFGELSPLWITTNYYWDCEDIES